MKYMNIYKLKATFITGLLLLSLGGYSQVIVEEPVYAEDFGTVPDNWKSMPLDYSDQSNINTFRTSLSAEKGNLSYSFATRAFEDRKWQVWPPKWIYFTNYRNDAMSDVNAGGTSWYALACNGETLGGSTWHPNIDHSGQTNGLAFLANIGSSGGKVFEYNFQPNVVQGGNVYKFQMWVANNEYNITSSFLTTKPNLKATLQGNGINIKASEPTDDIAATESIAWVLVSFYAEIPEGMNSFKYVVENLNGGTWAVGIYPGNVFVIDDISLSPMKVQASVVHTDFCSRPGTVLLEAQLDNKPDNLPVYARLMRKPVAGGSWEWAGNYQDSLKLSVPDADYHTYKYRVALGLTTASVEDAALLDEAASLNVPGTVSLTENFEVVYACETWSNFELGLKFCEDPAMAVFKGDKNSLPVNAPVHSRLMQRLRGSENEWDWKGEVSDTLDVRTDALDYLTYQYRVAHEVVVPDLLNKETPKAFMESDDHGCFTVKDIFRNDLCLNLFGVDFDYTSVPDSVAINPQMAEVDKAVYLRWLYRPTGSEEWRWMDEAKPATSNRMDWVTFTTGDFRAAFAMNPALLNAMSDTAIITKDYHYVATEEEAIKGIPLTVEIRKTFTGGGITLEAVTDKMPSTVTPVVKGFWLVREKEAGHWQRLDTFELRMGVPEYVRNEYRFVASMSQAVMDTLNVDALINNQVAYWVSDTIKGETVTLDANSRNYCEVQGEVVMKADFTNNGIPAEMPEVGRWQYREKGTAVWEWMSNFSGIKDLQAPMNEYLARDYRLVVAWSADSLDAWAAQGLPEKQDYYLLQDQFTDIPFCLTVDTIRIISNKRDELTLQPQYTAAQEGLTTYGRWMRKAKGGDVWEWLGEVANGNYNLTVSTADFGAFDYCFNMALAAVVLEVTPAGLAGVGYCHSKQIEGRQIFRPLATVPEITCVAHLDSNRVALTIQNPEQLKTVTYRIGNGEVQKVEADAQMNIGFTITRDSAFYLLSYAQEGVCDSIVRNDTLSLKYLPKLQITHFTDAFGCHNTDTKMEPIVIGGKEVEYQWYMKDELLPAQEDTLKILFDEVGYVPLKLRVGGEGVCPEDSTVFLITGDYPRITYRQQTAAKEVCVGTPFTVDYQLADAEQYRVTLKETSMPGFIFYPGTGNITVAENGILDIKSLQSVLLATDLMVGHSFTFRIQIFKVVEYRGMSYRCEDEFEYSFKVRPTVTAPYPSYVKLCRGEQLTLAPELELNGNEVTSYRWRLWDGASLSEQELKNSETDCTFDAKADGSWNDRRLQLTALCGCGEIIVQDINVMVFVADSNRIVGPDKIVLTGEKVNIDGSNVRFRDMEYVWENRKGSEEWKRMKDETGNSLAFYAPDTTTSYRRLLVGEGWTCPGMEAGPLVVRVYNNKVENRIYIQAQDTLIVAGTAVTVHSDAVWQEGLDYRWEQYRMGAWVEITGENEAELTCMPDEITKYRRVVLFGDNKLYSNEVVINVYSQGQNRILLVNGVLTPGEKVQVLGNYVGIQGVRYSWYANAGQGWQRLQGQPDCSVKMPLAESTKFIRYAYLPSQPEDSVASNEVTACVFDNAVDNRISCDGLDVCAGEEVNVTGVKIEGDGISYRWEYSVDGATSWIVLNNELGEGYTFKSAQNMLLRRRVQYTDAPEYYSNILAFNIIHNSADNRITQEGVGIAGESLIIVGSEVANASYRWEKSPDGENGWENLEGENGRNLQWDDAKVVPGIYLRRQLVFAGEKGCNAASNILKTKIFNAKDGNVISGPDKPVCQWSEFTLTGTDLSVLEAKYQWYRNKGQGWEMISQAITKDLTVYEGCGQATLYRREVVIGDMTNESNEQQIRLWNDIPVNNTLRHPGIICSGQGATIEGSDAFAGNMDLSGYLKSYSWEKSQTGAGSTWSQADTLNTRDLVLGKVEEPQWYCRVINTYCGNDLRSEPILLEVKDVLQFTLRNDAPFGSLNPKEPIRISIDQDYFRSYEILIDGKAKAKGAEFLFYGWMPKKKYEVVANVVASTGCAQTDTMAMYTPDVDLPNVLTPNFDGYNDILLKGYDLKVYNRWGNLLYSGRDGWDGKYKGVYVTAGTYFYVLKITHVGGEVTEYRKSVTVKRD